MRPGLSSLKWLHFSVPPGPASFSLGKESQGVAPPPQTCSLTHPGLGGASPTALPLLHLRRGLASPCSPGTGAGAGLPGLKLPTSLPVPSCWKPSQLPPRSCGLPSIHIVFPRCFLCSPRLWFAGGLGPGAGKGLRFASLSPPPCLASLPSSSLSPYLLWQQEDASSVLLVG